MSQESTDTPGALDAMPIMVSPVPMKKVFPFFIVLFGIVGPLLAIIIELSIRICARLFFDPLPSFQHLCLFLLLPVSTGLSLYAAHRPSMRMTVPGWLNGVAITVAFIYTLWFIPLMPMGLAAILFLGIGFFVFVPFFALLALILGRINLRDCLDNPRLPGLWPGILLGLVLFLAVESPFLITQYGLHLTMSASSAVKQRGENLLKAIGNRQALLHICHDNHGYNGVLEEISEMMWPSSPEAGMACFFHITGKKDNELPEVMFGGHPIFRSSD